jgi:tetratricopeptide (TPR) repeat protein
MFTVDTFLAKTEESESRIEAARLFAEGQKLLNAGDNVQAVERLQDALAIERQNRDYELALARAQLGAGQLQDAEMTLGGLLLADSTDGPANLTMARVLVKQGRIREGISYYHRAVYGTFKSDTAANRMNARFELIDLLAQQNLKEELLGELLAVAEQAPGDVPTQLRIGNLFLEAGSPDRAAVVFQKLLEQSPDNGAAYSGLGEADFTRGDYRAAVADFSQALRLNPEDRTAAQKLDLSNRVLALDPTRRGLDPAERLRRSRALLEMTVNAVGTCSTSAAVEEARKSLQERASAARQDARAEAELDLAEQLWQARPPGCGPPPGQTSDPLALVLAKTAR